MENTTTELGREPYDDENGNLRAVVDRVERRAGFERRTIKRGEDRRHSDKSKVETFRIRNGSMITVGDWVGIVVDQRGHDVWITAPVCGQHYIISRDSIKGGIAS